MNRRQYLATLGLGAAGSLAGCAGLFETGRSGEPPLVENRPDAVYVPTHVEGMQMVGMAMPGRYRIALSYSYPHRFWLLDGDDTNVVEIGDDDSIHLMASVWDAETGTAIPSSNASVSVRRDGDLVADRRLWPMLSQNMGFHYGDNVSLEGDGTYEVDLEFGPVGTRRTGGFRGAFGERATPSFTLEFSQSTLEETTYRRLSDRQGNRAAVDPMQMEMVPVPQLPAPADLPGTPLGEGATGDARFVATVLDAPPEGIDGSGSYLAVSPRTPYNRYPLPFLAVSATLSRDGQTPFDGALVETLDPDLRHHYGAVVDGVEAGDSLAIAPQTPPQVARHEGYETAFLDTSPIELTVDATGSS